MTFFLVATYLVLRYEHSMKKVDRLIKGLAMSFVFTVCSEMSIGSGACFNPMIGLVQSIYMIGIDSQ